MKRKRRDFEVHMELEDRRFIYEAYDMREAISLCIKDKDTGKEGLKGMTNLICSGADIGWLALRGVDHSDFYRVSYCGLWVREYSGTAMNHHDRGCKQLEE